MIRKLLASTAVVGLLATGAYAQTTTPAPMAPAGTETMPAQPQIERAAGHLASNIIGENVYNGLGDDAENIGEINDIVLGTNDGIEMVVIGVGGFLGLGQKNVAVAWSELKWGERDGEAYLVLETTKEALEAEAEFEVAAYDPSLGLPADLDEANTADASAPAPGATDDVAATDDAADDMADDTAEMADDAGDAAEDMAADTGEAVEEAGDDVAAATDEAAEDVAEATDEATDDMAAATDEAADDTAAATDEATDTMETAAIDRSTLSEVAADGISAETLIGTTVYGAGEENVGEIGDVILSDSGEIDSVIIDVGGFLGIGEKQVAVGMDNLQFLSDEDGDYYLYTEFTEEQLEAQPEYDEATWAEGRDDQRLILQ